MTSRNLCFKMMREDIKRRVWAIAWCILSMMFTLVVPVALSCSNYKTSLAEAYSSDALLYMARKAERLVAWLRCDVAAVVALVITAVIWAASGFHYLHNKQKVDFYHSIPVRRHQLFLAVYFNGIGVPLISFLVAQAASLCFVLSAGIDAGQAVSAAWEGFLFHAFYYGLIYTTVVLAMMMTGNVIVALLGTGVFFGYGPAVLVLVEGYFQQYFHSFISSYVPGKGMDAVIVKLLRYTSPLGNYIAAAVDLVDGKWQPWHLILVLAITGLLAAVSYLLYRMRASEAAGKAMAFEWLRTPIRILITIPAGVAAGLFFGEIGQGLGWMVFGTVCGAVICHCLMEIIYHFDFRKLFANRYQMVVCTVASLVLGLAGYYDLYGYDAWHPSADQIEDATIYETNADYWVSYGKPVFESRGEDRRYNWDYVDADAYRMDHMKLTDVYAVSELIRRGAALEKEHRFTGWVDVNFRTYLIRVKLKGGREVYRRYRIAVDEESEKLLASLMDSREYKEGMYPVMTQPEEVTAEVSFVQYGNLEDGNAVDLDADGCARLLEAFKQDMLELTLARQKEEVPIGMIRFATDEMKEALDYNLERNEKHRLGGRCYYPVYPSFARTLGLLEEAGVKILNLGDEVIGSIEVEYYELDEMEQKFLLGEMDQKLLPVLPNTGSAAGQGEEQAADPAAEQGEPAAEQWEPAADQVEPAAEQANQAENQAADQASDQEQPMAGAEAALPEVMVAGGIVKYEDEADIAALAPALVSMEYVGYNSYYDRSHFAYNVYVRVRLQKDGDETGKGTAYQNMVECYMDLSKIPQDTAQRYGLLGDR